MIEHQEESLILLRSNEDSLTTYASFRPDNDDHVSISHNNQRTRRRTKFKILPYKTFKSPNQGSYCTSAKQRELKYNYKSKSASPTSHQATARRKLIAHTRIMSSPRFISILLLTFLLGATTMLSLAQENQALLIGKRLPSAEALMRNSDAGNSDKQQDAAESTNVILIKYANVTKTDQQQNSNNNADDATPSNADHELQLNTFKLYEPLSVSIIESKFSHSIQLFDVSFNQLSTLSKDLFCPLSNEVRQLNISHNLLENFDCIGLISQAGQLCLGELKVLDMSYNLIKHLPATGVATLRNLEILNLSNNLIESLDELSLSSLFKLTKLDLSSNRIQQLALRTFHKSISMKVLNLQSNQLQTSINEQLLAGMISLEVLNLSYNNISHIVDSPFFDKTNLTRVDLRHNLLTSLKQDALKVSSVRQQVALSTSSSFRPRLHHNGQFANVASKQQQQIYSQTVSQAEFYLSSNPFVCDCTLEWLRKFQMPSAIKRPVLPHTMLSRYSDQDQLNAQQLPSPLASSNIYQNDQPSVILASPSLSSSLADAATNNISEIISIANQQNSQLSTNLRPTATSTIGGSGSHNGQHWSSHGRVGDLESIKCSPLFRRNTQRHQHHSHHHSDRQQQMSYHRGGQSRAVAPSIDTAHHGQLQQHHQTAARQQDSMIDLLSVDSSNFLCRYKSHCFALCHCCEFDACDCEMICPTGCNCYYDSTWQTNIIDCSSSNHTVVPDRIPMDVSGLYLDGNNIDSLKPSNLIARKSLKTLYLNSSNLQFIANRTFNGLIELQTLYLHDNMLRTLNGYEFEPLAQLRALYLQSNKLDHINNQTFIYLRSLEILDLSNNRLTSTNLDLFWSIGHHNIRLRQLSIAHNWWSCQCSSINRFRQILKQKFLLSGSVNIADKNQLRCYYNSTTVGPLILGDTASITGLTSQPLYASYSSNARQQTQLTELNQCSELLDEDRLGMVDLNPPLIQAITETPAQPTPPSDFPNDPYYNQPRENHQNPFISNNPGPILDQQIPSPPDSLPLDFLYGPHSKQSSNSDQRATGSGITLTTFILLVAILAGILMVGVFMLVRKQQRYHQNHHKKSSAASTASASSSASSTAISSLNGKSSSSVPRIGGHPQHPHGLHHQHTMHHPHAQHHLIMSNGSAGGATITTATGINHHLLGQHPQQTHHHHSASSQSNIYAALVSPTTGNSTTVTSNAANMNMNASNNNNLYSNSSTTASHHSSSSHSNVYPQHWPLNGHNQLQSASQHQSVYGQPTYNGMNALENQYTLNNSSGPYKVGSGGVNSGSLYNVPHGSCYDSAIAGSNVSQQQNSDWIKMPKVKQFMSKLVNKSLALGGYRACSRDELSAVTSDKIYDAFISYDKRDEEFVMRHLSAELEYGQPQYR